MDIRSLIFQVFARQDDQGGQSDDQENGAQKLLDLLQNPFSDTLAAASIYSALAISLSLTAFTAVCFSLLRPYNQAIYAPKLKHADELHAPPPIGRKPWSWVTPLWNTREDAMIQQVGMDAVIFLRFVRMCRNMFLCLCLIGVGILLPINITNYSNRNDPDDDATWLTKITPLNTFDNAQWSQVAAAYLFDIVVACFLWWNYRKILQLRLKFFESPEYQNSLHSRTLMLYDLPKQARSDEGIARIIDGVAPNSSFARTAVARNVKDLPELIAQHDHAVRRLEEILAKYLKNPQQLPPARPLCKPSKKDRSYSSYPRGQRVDAIEYYTQRIRDLEVEVREVRLSVDKRGSMPYGFASYSEISEAHSIAFACRKKRPNGATITLAPRPNDIIWTNMPIGSASRSRRRWINNLWITLLTLLWVGPNAMIAIFLVNLGNLGKVWPAFNNSLEANTTLWGVIQGILSPAVMSLVYLVLPIIFRRLAIRAGDQTKTGRERHVLGKLYYFFIFNNLIVFSVFNTIWTFVSSVVNDTHHGLDAWHAIIKGNMALGIFTSLCQNSPFWVTYLLQRQLGAAIDLAQLWPLVQAFFLKKFSSPTPRELIELTAPPPFEYASYYNYFLYYATVAMCFAGIQPLVLPATALYFCIDAWLKKYLIMYRFVTKTESGGMFWRVVFNRFIFGAVLANLVVLLTTWVRGNQVYHTQFYAVVPLPFLMIAFKLYCTRAFDNKIRYYSTMSTARHPESGGRKEGGARSERLASRFGHPALYKPLITPMVHQKAQNLLPAVYKGRLTDGREAGAADLMSVSGYSDMYALDAMQGGKPGKSAGAVPGFEYVAESQMDFEYYKNRAEFADEHGGGEIFGRPGEIVRPSTPGGSYIDGELSRPGTPGSASKVPYGPGNNTRTFTGSSQTNYQAYRQTPPAGYNGFTQQPTMISDLPSRTRSPLYASDNGSASALVANAAGAPMSTPGGGSREASMERRPTPGARSPPVNTPGPSVGALGGGPRGYSGLAQSERVEPEEDPTQYDYFRSSARTRRNPGEGW